MITCREAESIPAEGLITLRNGSEDYRSRMAADAAAGRYRDPLDLGCSTQQMCWAKNVLIESIHHTAGKLAKDRERCDANRCH